MICAGALVRLHHLPMAVLLWLDLAGCVAGHHVRPEDPPPLDDDRDRPCDPAGSAPLAVPDFFAETMGRLDGATRASCLLLRVPRGGDGVVFPPPVEMTADQIASACTRAPSGCAPVCEAALRAEVALRLYRRVDNGVDRVLRVSDADPRCGDLIAATPDTLDGAAARALWACLHEPLPERVQLTLTLATETDGYRRVVDVDVRADFVPRRAGEAMGRVHRLGLVTQYQGCGVATPTWTLAGQDLSAAGSVDDSCQEYGEYHCQAYCQDDQNTSCSFARMVAPEAETP